VGRVKALDLPCLRDNLQRVREGIHRAAERSGRDGGSVELMAVTKTHPLATVRLAIEAGLELFGENRVQEAELKYALLVSERSEPEQGLAAGQAAAFRLHLIGHLQRNKAKNAAALFGCVQSIDKPETAEALERACASAGRTLDILLELNTSGEESKFGFESEDELRRCLPGLAACEHLRLRGLMTVGPFTGDRERIRQAFARLYRLYRRLEEEHQFADFDTVSMGMSGDYEIAVEEGATMVRLGTVLFGPRQP